VQYNYEKYLKETDEKVLQSVIKKAQKDFEQMQRQVCVLEGI